MNCNLKMGYLLYRTKGFVEHCGIYVGNNKVLHNSPKNGLEITSCEDFAKGLGVKVIKTEIEDSSVLTKRIQEIISSNTRYNFALNNCEHLATFLIYGRKYSAQIQASILGGIIGLLLGKNKNVKSQLMFVVVAGVAGCILSNAVRQYDYEMLPKS